MEMFLILSHLSYFSTLLETCIIFVDSKSRTLKTDSFEEKCPHNEVMYNMKLAGGLKAGKFTDIGRVKGINTCIRYCCDSKVDCDLAFMLDKRLVYNYLG